MSKTELDTCPDAFDDKKNQIQMWYSKDFVYFNWYKKEIQIAYDFEDFKEIIKALKYTQKKMKGHYPKTTCECHEINYESENSSVYFDCDGLDKKNKPYFQLNVPPVSIYFSAIELLQISNAFFVTEKILKQRGLI